MIKTCHQVAVITSRLVFQVSGQHSHCSCWVKTFLEADSVLGHSAVQHPYPYPDGHLLHQGHEYAMSRDAPDKTTTEARSEGTDETVQVTTGWLGDGSPCFQAAPLLCLSLP